VPWIPGTAMVICDLVWLDEAHSPVVESPRQVLRAQVDRATQQVDGRRDVTAPVGPFSGVAEQGAHQS